MPGREPFLHYFALVEATRGAAWPFDARQCGQVEHSPQPAVVALRAVQVAPHSAGIAGYRCEAGVGGRGCREWRAGRRRCRPAAGPQDRPEAVDSGDPFGVGVSLEAFGELLVKAFDLPVQAQQLAGQPAISGGMIDSADRETVYSPAAAQDLSTMDGMVRLCSVLQVDSASLERIGIWGNSVLGHSFTPRVFPDLRLGPLASLLALDAVVLLTRQE